MTQVVNVKRTHDYDVYIGRGRCPRTGEAGRWGNPFSHRPGTAARFRVATRDEAVDGYRRWLWDEIGALRISLPDLAALDGKTLGCWCAPEACHGDVLARAAAWAAGPGSLDPEAFGCPPPRS